jgi:hypothetical protein
MNTTDGKEAAKRAMRAALNPELAAFTRSDFAELPEQFISSKYATIRLLNVDVAHLKVPKWDKFDLWEFVFKVGYKRFVKSIDGMNQKKPITRLEMESLWLRFLLRKYDEYDP